ncbi:uncharacterized protein LOC111085744 isoform X2 [Limulus polyphemus]|uniref:Uncharacterized protein LOC111085744 isoform X2 n=1 Tax=Limulus polyphemus TaxID=6850 RepID=A0ABM1SCV7_LIMPO|nr:uncharacterized protein LOC111085744 isoform X2 [Limulus polyphemus]
MFLYQAAVLILFMVVVNQECEGTFDIDEPCGYLGMCHINNSYCNEKKRCACKPDYPLYIIGKTCSKGEDNVQSYVIMFIILIIMAFGLTIGIIFLFCRIKRKKRNIQTSELSCCGKTVLGRMEQSRSHEPVEEPPPTYEEAVAIDFPSDIMENNLSPNELNYEQYYCPSAPTYCK